MNGHTRKERVSDTVEHTFWSPCCLCRAALDKAVELLRKWPGKDIGVAKFLKERDD